MSEAFTKEDDAGQEADRPDRGMRCMPDGSQPSWAQDAVTQWDTARATGKRRAYAAFRLTLLSAMSVSFLSAAFSSFRVCSSTLATSLRPSRFAQAMREPYRVIS
jgi:hypothetical protein